ncbi:hypothetical protein HG536_0G04900 [Torulaspora globosa]|uniref:Transcriptional regulator n=1 Tax=Torulaspora globosa TaxID=48254 RepID=A0A7G3ZM92_9SACH|nr:uncharacterized protein HG536_0G04900 [Torulaspora globosa]QLL34628.1 hypothetical protein HG536_0G04900 [Torulaspora globosa]
MYIPKQYEVTDLAKQIEVIQKNPLGILFTARKSNSGLLSYVLGGSSDAVDSELCATHLPFLFVEGKGGQKHKLIAHMAAKNGQIAHLEESGRVLIVFQGPHSYMSPSWCPTKKKTHKVVPGWYYATLHVYGTPKIIRDKKWLLDQVSQLSDQEEGKRPEGAEFEEKWKVTDAPERVIDAKLNGVVGVEIEISDMQCKFRFGQEMSKEDIEGVIHGFEHELGGEHGADLANIARECYSSR